MKHARTFIRPLSILPYGADSEGGARDGWTSFVVFTHISERVTPTCCNDAKHDERVSELLQSVDVRLDPRWKL